MESEVVKLGKKGQLNVPREIMERLGLHGGDMLLLEVDDEGAILLRPTGVYPLELYSDERVAEFAEADELSPEQRKRLTEGDPSRDQER
ncbi:AbrB/MazE/SpoVT family DNA-binding domain-containing protein [soil metagenome]|jgi:AbrB family looped-hinge helix DNA binding protein